MKSSWNNSKPTIPPGIKKHLLSQREVPTGQVKEEKPLEENLSALV